ncbi:MAG: metal-dependent transcriptional regulator [Candidatus Micrarchaeia archaeon]
MRKVSEKTEEYLETIYRLKEQGKDAKTSDVAKELKVSKPSVSGMFKKMKRDGLIEYSPYKGAKLTKKGKEIGESILRKHRLLEKFLAFLGIKGEVHEEACMLEHAVSDKVEHAIHKTLSEEKKNLKKLSEMGEGEVGRVSFIMAGRGASQRLCEMGVTKGTEIKVVKRTSYFGPISVSVRGSTLAVGRGLASRVFVEVEK